MNRHLAQIALLVRDYDEAKAYYVGTLGFELLEDTPMGGGKRWVVLAPPGAAPRECRILLAKAKDESQAAAIGRQGGGRVVFFLKTDDFWRDYEAWKAKGVAFIERPRHEAFGTVAVFEDLYGNRWDLIGPLAPTGPSR